MYKRLLTSIIAAFMLGSLLLVTSFAQTTTQSQGFQYVVKFICGDADATDSAGLDLNGDGAVDTGQFIARGEYSTVINIHNPNSRFVNMFKKIALDGYRIESGRPRFLFQVPGPIFFINIVDGTKPPLAVNFPLAATGTRFFSLTPKAIELSPDETFQVNCAEIRAVTNDYTNRTAPTRAGDTAQAVNAAGDFGTAFLIKGYFVLFSEARLDVDAIYTACGEGASSTAIDCGRGVQSFSITRIKENAVAPPSNLVPPRPTTAVGLTAEGRELRVDLGAQSLTAFAEARLQVFNQQGKLLHDSGYLAGTQLSWRMLDAPRPLANGLYFYVISAKDVFGRVSSHVGKFALLR